MTSHSSDAPDIHLPGPSFWPIVMAAGVMMIAAGVLLTPVISGLGLVVVLTCIAGWTQENRLEAPPDDDEEEAHG